MFINQSRKCHFLISRFLLSPINDCTCTSGIVYHKGARDGKKEKGEKLLPRMQHNIPNPYSIIPDSGALFLLSSFSFFFFFSAIRSRAISTHGSCWYFHCKTYSSASITTVAKSPRHLCNPYGSTCHSVAVRCGYGQSDFPERVCYSSQERTRGYFGLLDCRTTSGAGVNVTHLAENIIAMCSKKALQRICNLTFIHLLYL